MSEPLTAQDLALLRESTDPQYRRLPMPERELVARLLAALPSPETTPVGVLDEAALAKALDRVGPGTVADMAWSPAKWEWRADLGYWSAVEDAAGHTVDDDYPMASLAHALAAALGRSGSGGGRG